MLMSRVGQNNKYTVYIRYFWQGNHQIYGHIRCIYTVLANPIYIGFWPTLQIITRVLLPYTHTHTHTHTRTHTHTHRAVESFGEQHALPEGRFAVPPGNQCASHHSGLYHHQVCALFRPVYDFGTS